MVRLPGMSVAEDDERVGRLCRLLRRRLGMSQRELARRSEVPREDVMLIEAAGVGAIEVDRARRVFEALGAQLKVRAWWNGATADRLLDERHAALVERAIRVLSARAWRVLPEVTYSEFGERGSVDIFAGHEPTRCLLVGEVKGSLGSLEETNRLLDVKARLAPKLAADRFDWEPVSVSRVLVLPDDRTVRRIVDRHRETMAAKYPLRSRGFRAWLRAPSGSVAAIWFLSEIAGSDRVAA
jgi:transcriptional regulator with XRE-family HTH domain